MLEQTQAILKMFSIMRGTLDRLSVENLTLIPNLKSGTE